MTSEESLLIKFRGLPTHRKQQAMDFAEFLMQKEGIPLRSLRAEGVLSNQNIKNNEECFNEARDEMRGNTEDTR